MLVINVVLSSAVAFPFSTAITASPLTSIRVERPGTYPTQGVYGFGERVPGDRLIRLNNLHRYVIIPPNRDGGVREHIEIIRIPNGERITRVELRSQLGNDSEGERIHEIGYGPNHQSVTIKFWSKEDHGLDFTIIVYGV